MTLDAGCTVTVEAIDPLTGADVADVTLSRVAIYGTHVAPSVPPAAHDPAFTHAGSEG